MALGTKTRLHISRTIQTAPYESVRVELEEEFVFESEAERTQAFKELSTTLEKMTNHERRKYKKEDKE